MKNTALITGCTSGIGLHLTHEFAKHGHELIPIAHDSNELQALASEIGTGAECDEQAACSPRRTLPEEKQTKFNRKQYEQVPSNECARQREDMEREANYKNQSHDCQ